MKRFLSVLVLLVGLVLAPTLTHAQSYDYTTGLQIQNLSTTTSATVTVTFYNPNGTTAATQTGSIAAGASVTFYPLGAPPSGWTGGTVPANFSGSAVVSSDQPVAAITTVVGTQGSSTFLGSYNGISTGATSVVLPIVFRNNFGYNTWFSVQNTGSTDASVTVQYVKGAGQSGTNYTSSAVTIQEGAARDFNQATDTNLGSSFVGIAIVTSDQPVAVSVVQENGTVLMAYDGINDTSAATSMVAPLVVANNYGFYTGIGVTNVGSAATTVTVTYGANTSTLSNKCSTPSAETVPNLAANSGAFVVQNTTNARFSNGCHYVGSATITTSPATDIVVVVNQVNDTGYASSYEAFDPAAATNTIKVPLIMANNGGFFTGIQVMNADGSSASRTVTIAYGANTVSGTGTCTGTPPAATGSIAGGRSFTTLQNAGYFATCRYVGSATITAPAGSKLVAIVNEVASSADTLMTYGGVNQ